MISWLQELWQNAGWFAWFALVNALAVVVVLGGRTWQRVSANPNAPWIDRPMALMLSLYVGVLGWLIFTWLAGAPIVGEVFGWAVLAVAGALLCMVVVSVMENTTYYRTGHPHMRHTEHK